MARSRIRASSRRGRQAWRARPKRVVSPLALVAIILVAVLGVMTGASLLYGEGVRRPGGSEATPATRPSPAPSAPSVGAASLSVASPQEARLQLEPSEPLPTPDPLPSDQLVLREMAEEHTGRGIPAALAVAEPGLELNLAPGTVASGEALSVTIRTEPDAYASARIALGEIVARLETRRVGAQGEVTWSWEVPPEAAPGIGSVEVTVSLGQAARTTRAVFQVGR